MRTIAVGNILALLLCSCSEGSGSLKAELAARVEEQRGNALPPLPFMRPTPEFRYEAGRLPDPFYPERR